MRARCIELDAQLTKVAQSGLAAQPDSRSVGAHVEKAVIDQWPAICAQLGVSANPRPGRRTIYDASWTVGGDLVGIDVRTKDLDERRYADGGLCSVGNLLGLLVKNRGVLLISEFGYREEHGHLVFDDVRTAPIHALPLDIFRIENLGTGQVRLDQSVFVSYENVDWERPVDDFVRPFAEMAINHYGRVASKAGDRAEALRSYLHGGELKLS